MLPIGLAPADGTLHQGQTFMVVGAAGEPPKPPEEPIKFLEDMDDSELADAVGLSLFLIHFYALIYL
jgi:ubiquitin carboxyl-terminal hydrolase 14